MSSLRLGILSDLHRTTNPRERHEWHNEYDFPGHHVRVADALAWFEQEAIDALALTGDLVHTADPAAMRAVLDECRAGVDVPVIAVSGNHDVADGVDVLAAAVQRIGDGLLVQASTHGEPVSGIRVAGLQLVPGLGYSSFRVRELPHTGAWSNEPVVMLSHVPLLSRAAAVAAHDMRYAGDLTDRERTVAPLLARTAPTIVLSGHIHIRDVHAQGPVLQIVQAALVEPPFEAAVVDIRTEDDGSVLVSRRVHRTSDRQAEQEPILTAESGSWRFGGRGWDVAELLSANHRTAANVDSSDRQAVKQVGDLR